MGLMSVGGGAGGNLIKIDSSNIDKIDLDNRKVSGTNTTLTREPTFSQSKYSLIRIFVYNPGASAPGTGRLIVSVGDEILFDQTITRPAASGGKYTLSLSYLKKWTSEPLKVQYVIIDDASRVQVEGFEIGKI